MNQWRESFWPKAGETINKLSYFEEVEMMVEENVCRASPGVSWCWAWPYGNSMPFVTLTGRGITRKFCALSTDYAQGSGNSWSAGSGSQYFCTPSWLPFPPHLQSQCLELLSQLPSFPYATGDWCQEINRSNPSSSHIMFWSPLPYGAKLIRMPVDSAAWNGVEFSALLLAPCVTLIEALDLCAGLYNEDNCISWFQH